MLHHKAYQFRIYPTPEQATLINKTIGCTRFVYNRYLALWSDTYKETGKGLSYGACSAELTKLKQEIYWLKEPDKFSLQNALRNLSDAYHRFFKKQTDAPKFKSKKNPLQSYQTNYTNGNIELVDHQIKLPKLGLVKYAKSREVEGRILNATIRRNPSGKYFVSVLAEVGIDELPKTGQEVGIDVGLKDFAILSNGVVARNPKFFRRLEEKLARAQLKTFTHDERQQQLEQATHQSRAYSRENHECSYGLLAKDFNANCQKPRHHCD